MQRLLGIKEEVRYFDTSVFRCNQNNRENVRVYRLIVYMNNQLAVSEIFALFQCQYNTLHEAIVYQSSDFHHLLSVLERCDDISAYPENATWNPIGVHSIKQVSGLQITLNQPSHVVGCESYEAKFSYFAQSQMDGIQLSVPLDYSVSNIKKWNFDSIALSNLPQITFNVPRSWQPSIGHWIFDAHPASYHLIDVEVWLDILKDPKLAWEVGHTLWLHKCNNTSMTYPAATHLLDVIYDFLDLLTSASQLQMIPQPLQKYLDANSWEYIQKNSPRLLAPNTHLKADYDSVKQKLFNVITQAIAYESSKVYQFLCHFISFLQSFYDSKKHLSFDKAVDANVQHYYDYDLFPLMLLENLPFDHLLANFTTPLLFMRLHLKEFEVCRDGRVSALSLAQCYASQKFSLYANPSAYQDHHISRYFCNYARYLLIASLFEMFDRLKISGGVLERILPEHKELLVLDSSTFNVDKEIALLKVMLYVLFHHLRRSHNAVNFFGAFDLAMPTVNELQDSLSSIMFAYGLSAESKRQEVSLSPHYSFWNSSFVESYDWLPVNGFSPFIFFALSAWLNFCFVQYKRNDVRNLGAWQSVEHFVEAFLAPAIEEKGDVIIM